MPRARTTRVYKKGSRFYGDFRDIGGKLEALKPLGLPARDKSRVMGQGEMLPHPDLRRGGLHGC